MAKVKEMASGGGGNSVGSAGTMGFNIPMGMKKRKKKVDEVLSLHEDIHEGHMLSFMNGMSEEIAEQCGAMLDEGDYNSFAEQVRNHMVREVVRSRVKEIVRKKAGGGGYVLYSPNSGKKKQSKAVGNFPTKLGAKKAELARFPPKDPDKLKRARKEVDKLLKDPKKAAAREKQAQHTKGHEEKPKKSNHKKEGLELLRSVLTGLVNESLFHEERTGSDWDDYIGRLSKQAVAADKKFQNLQKNIDKKTSQMLKDSFTAIQKNVDRKKVKLKDLGIKAAPEAGKTYLAFSATLGQAVVEPMAIYIEGGVPKIELSDQAKAGLTKADPSDAKAFRAELILVQEKILDKMGDLEKAISNRDKYLTRLEDEVDDFVSDMTPLQISLLKQLLVKKYRKIA